MDEYISKQKLLKNFCGYDLTKCQKYGNKTSEQLRQSYDTLMIYEIAMEIDDAPAADVQPIRRGEWIYGENDVPHCSECGTEPKEISPYCPNCGAKMDGEDDDNA